MPHGSHLQHGHLLAVAKQPERQGVFGVQPRDDLAAAERDGDDVGLQVGPVLVEDELIFLDAAPALPPAAVGEHVQVACNESRPVSLPRKDAHQEAVKTERTPHTARLQVQAPGSNESRHCEMTDLHQLWGLRQDRPPRSPNALCDAC